MIQKGFTLIELMIVVAVIGILATFAIPSYQDYVFRSQVAEGFVLVEELKINSKDFYKSELRFPKNNAEAGLPDAKFLMGNYVKRIELVDGAFHITYGNKINAAIQGKTLTVRPAVVTGSPLSPFVWLCGNGVPVEGMEAVGEDKTDIDPKFLPRVCRG
jgi:type IV pilus assembly protein PilA